LDGPPNKKEAKILILEIKLLVQMTLTRLLKPSSAESRQKKLRQQRWQRRSAKHLRPERLKQQKPNCVKLRLGRLPPQRLLRGDAKNLRPGRLELPKQQKPNGVKLRLKRLPLQGPRRRDAKRLKQERLPKTSSVRLTKRKPSK